jgi:hypothetical protein
MCLRQELPPRTAGDPVESLFNGRPRLAVDAALPTSSCGLPGEGEAAAEHDLTALRSFEHLDAGIAVRDGSHYSAAPVARVRVRRDLTFQRGFHGDIVLHTPDSSAEMGVVERTGVDAATAAQQHAASEARREKNPLASSASFASARRALSRLSRRRAETVGGQFYN